MSINCNMNGATSGESTVSNIILGGGLAGLSAAYHSNAVVYESESVPGGVAKSKDINGFIFDYGIHVLHTKNPIVLKLLTEIEVDLLTVERNAWIFSNNSLTRFPFQANTYGLPTNIVKDCLIGFIDNKFKDKRNIKNYYDWLLYMFGEGYVKHFMVPYAEKFWGVNANELNTDWVNVRHPRPSLDEVITGALTDQKKGFGINATFRYPCNGGYGTIASQLAKNLGKRIMYNKCAKKINTKLKKVAFSDGSFINYKNIFSSLSLAGTLSLLDDVPTHVQAACNLLRANSFQLIQIAVDRKNISDKSWIYYSDQDISFVRISFPSNMSPNTVPDSCSSILVEISYGPNDIIPSVLENVIPKVLDDLIKVGVLKKEDNILFAHTHLIPKAYVIFDKNRKSSIDIIHTFLNNIGIKPFGRYGRWDYLWSDESIVNGRQIGQFISSEYE